jgi:hypothetical protein
MLSQSFVQVSKENATICDKGAIVNHLAARGKGKFKPKVVLSCIFHDLEDLLKRRIGQVNSACYINTKIHIATRR